MSISILTNGMFNNPGSGGGDVIENIGGSIIKEVCNKRMNISVNSISIKNKDIKLKISLKCLNN